MEIFFFSFHKIVKQNSQLKCLKHLSTKGFEQLLLYKKSQNARLLIKK
mgnify:CR=1 FL=1